MQKKILFSLLFLVCLSVLVLFPPLSRERVYDYAQTQQKINNISSFSGEYRGHIELAREMNSFVLRLPHVDTPEDIRVTWTIAGKEYERYIDQDDLDSTEYLYTFPVVVSGVTGLDVRVTGLDDPDALVELISMDTKTYHTTLGWSYPGLWASNTRVISRAEWGADESIRFFSSATLSKKISEWEQRGRTPKVVEITPKEQEASRLETAQQKIITALHPESTQVIAKVRYEHGQKLIWPITRTRSVDRITLHHTAENIEQDADDATILRAIYIYHARTRGWGDIGYNYIIGQKGDIYEGRAGGDYVQGAHAYANNLGTVGISVMGNFENIVPSLDQQQGIENAVVLVAQKYGIDILGDTVGFAVCKSNDPGCIIQQKNIKKLHSHREVGVTACPGKNLYPLIDSIRSKAALRIGQVQPVYNMETPDIHPLAPEDRVTYVLTPVPISGSGVGAAIQSVTPAIQVSPSLGGPIIQIKLSYPLPDNISLSMPTQGLPTLRIGSRRIPLNSTKNINVGIVGTNGLIVKSGDKTYSGTTISYSGPLVRIDSWSRVPSWDTAGKYNDNIFRSKITLRNQDGKLLVVNELPVEDYLRGLGEVSNTDNREKIQVITVAARSYARYYMDRAHRKYNTPLYDGSDDPDSFQKYLGYGYESRSPNVSQAVRDTRGQVITYHNKIIKAWYHSSSDGRTLSSLEYCQNNGGQNCIDVPYLQSVADPGSDGRTRSGHGVGISGIGATYWATQGWDYKRIIQYYMNGVEIQKK